MTHRSAHAPHDVPAGTAILPAPRLRIWPGVVFAVLLVSIRVLLPAIAPDAEIFGVPAMMVAILGAVVFGLAIFIWWLFFSRASWLERLGTIAVMVSAVAITWLLVDESIRGGFMGMMLPIYAIPVLGVALVIGVAASHGRSNRRRRASVAVAIVLGCGLLAAIRTDGITGEGNSQLQWRWTPTAEQRLLSQAASEQLPHTPTSPPPVPPADPPHQTVTANASPSAVAPSESGAPSLKADVTSGSPSEPAGKVGSAGRDPSPASASTPVAWPGFRGRERNGVVRDVFIETDWTNSPPVEMWRRAVGPGWSSIAVAGDLVYTQEQRGEQEVVSCYRLSTGEPVWRHTDAVRFYESNGGAGPRGTPTVHNGRVYTLGATGILNVLDAATGAQVWSRNAAVDAEVTIPDWGIASSPLVVNDLVIVALSGRLAAYDIRNGDPRWLGPAGGAGYSSPHFVLVDGVPQIVLLRGSRTISVAPTDGTLLWQHTWQPGVSIVQPALVGDRDLLVSAGDAMGGLGLRRLTLRRKASQWNVEERWTSRGLKPYFNDFVVHKGYAYGFDGNILAALDLETGERKWKGGRYGHGQMLLLAAQDLLLVTSEDGELALVSATPDKYTEIARFPALDAKTWAHPVIAGDTLLVRNGEEMAAFRLPVATTR